MNITKENLEQISSLLDDMAWEQKGGIEGLYCPECQEKSTWVSCEVGCEDCGTHFAVVCENCGERYDSIHSRYIEIEEYNIKRYNDL